MAKQKRIMLYFTDDSKRHRRGLPMREGPFSTLKKAGEVIRCGTDRRGKPVRPRFTKHDPGYYGYKRSWEVTCGEAVVADAHELHPGQSPDEPIMYDLLDDEETW